MVGTGIEETPIVFHGKVRTGVSMGPATNDDQGIYVMLHALEKMVRNLSFSPKLGTFFSKCLF